jgi:type IV pilus assembly protein PilA
MSCASDRQAQQRQAQKWRSQMTSNSSEPTTHQRQPRERARRAHKRTTLAFTLVELMAVVAMVGILAALALVGYRRYLHASKSGEAKEIIGQIHVAEASYRAETLGYLDCSSSVTAWYPSLPNGKKRHWVSTSHADKDCWRMLNVGQDSPTYYGFVVIAELANVAPTTPSWMTTGPTTWPTPTEPWYIVGAAGDNDEDGTLTGGAYSYLLSSSFAPSEIIVQDETE